MSRKIKSANKVETGIRGCFFCRACVFLSPFFSVSQHPVFPEKTAKGSRFSFDVKKEKVNRLNADCFSYVGRRFSVLPQSCMM